MNLDDGVMLEERSARGFEHSAIVLEDSDEERDGACPTCGDPWGEGELIGCDGLACGSWVHVRCTRFGNSSQRQQYLFVLRTYLRLFLQLVFVFG